jgi:hypothetical protein
MLRWPLLAGWAHYNRARCLREGALDDRKGFEQK